MKQTPHTKFLVFSVVSVLFFSGCSLVRPDTWRDSPSQTGSTISSETGSNSQSGQTEVISQDDLRYREVLVPEEQFLTDRFAILSQRFSTYDELLVSEDFRTFVEYVYSLFEKYQKDPKTNAQEAQILYEKIIPKIVYENWFYNKKATQEESEILIQAIKNNQFITPLEKDAIGERTKKYLENAIFIPYESGAIISEFMTAKSDNSVFKKLFLDPDNGVLYTFLKAYYIFDLKSWVWYKPEDLEGNLEYFVIEKLEAFLLKMGWTKEEIKQRVFQEQGVHSVQEYGQKLIRDFDEIKTRFSLDSVFPVNRIQRDDEDKKIFNSRESVDYYVLNITHQQSGSFIQLVKQYRLNYLLLQYFGQEVDETLNGTGFTERFGMVNLFNVSSFFAPEIMHIDWSNESKQ